KPGAQIMGSLPYFPQGHYELDQLVLDWDSEFSTTKQGDVVLTASFEDQPNSPTSVPSSGRTATTLAFRMDHSVAMALHGRLTVLGQNMGWLPATRGRNQA